jgi:hypothetical protein
MARYDKYEPYSGGYRAPLAGALAKTSGGNPKAVSFDANGRAKTDGALNHTGYKGVVCTVSDKVAGDIVDIMTHGEVVEFTGVAGTNYFIDAADGVIKAGAGADTKTPPAAVGSVYVGFTVEATRLIVRMGTSPVLA